MNVALEQGEPFWLDFEHRVLEWKASEIRPTSDGEHTFGDEKNIMISSSDNNQVWFSLVSLFNGISTFVGYLMPKLFF